MCLRSGTLFRILETFRKTTTVYRRKIDPFEKIANFLNITEKRNKVIGLCMS